MAADEVPRGIAHPTAASPPRFTVIVPTLGDEAKLVPLLEALRAQTLTRDRWDLVVSFDGTGASPALAARLAALGGHAVVSRARHGPGAARNLGARGATTDYLAFTEDDCVPAAEWLAAAAARLDREPGLDVIEGATRVPDGAPARRRRGDDMTWLPTNLVVRREFFERIGGYHEGFFDARRGVYFREDSDFGFSAVEGGAAAVYDPALIVVHPREHPRWLDPLRWARRYEMDPLLARRHPAAFRAGIEVLRVGPVAIRRPFVRACAVFALTAVGAAAAWPLDADLAKALALVAAVALAAVWAKWRFDPLRLPLMPIVPFVLLASLWLGARRTGAA